MVTKASLVPRNEMINVIYLIQKEDIKLLLVAALQAYLDDFLNINTTELTVLSLHIQPLGSPH